MTWTPSGSLKDGMLGKSSDDQDDERVKILDKCLNDSLKPFALVAHLLMELLSCEDMTALQSILNHYGGGLLQNAQNAQNAAASEAGGASRTSFLCPFLCPSSLAEMRKVFEVRVPVAGLQSYK